MKWIKRLFNRDYETFKCITVDYGGETRFRTARRYKSGVIVIQTIHGWAEANPDGTFSNSYMKKMETIVKACQRKLNSGGKESH